MYILTTSAFIKKCGDTTDEQQEILNYLNDIMIEIYGMESGLLRALKSIESVGEQKSRLKIDMMKVYTNNAMRRIEDYATEIFSSTATGDTINEQLALLKNFTYTLPVNIVALRNHIVDRITDAEMYLF